MQNGEIKMFDSSYFELGQTKLSLSELKYTGADRDGITKFLLKKSILKFFRTTKWNAKNDARRRPKNLLHVTFEDEKRKYCTLRKDWNGWEIR